MANFGDVSDLESLFIQKLTEKYTLTKKDLKKAFMMFDKDENGLLDLNELTQAIKMFLNGVNEKYISELITVYDLNGDGKISYEELLYCLTNRLASKKKKSLPSSVKHNSKISQAPNRMDERKSTRLITHRQEYSEEDSIMEDYNDYERESEGRDYEKSSVISSNSNVQSAFDIEDLHQLEYRSKSFFKSLRAFLLQRVSASNSSRPAPGAGPGGSRSGPGARDWDRLTMTASQYNELAIRKILTRAFAEYIIESGNGRKNMRTVEYSDFVKVVRMFNIPGTPSLRNEVLDYIYSLCEVQSSRNDISFADPNIFADFVLDKKSVPSEERSPNIPQLQNKLIVGKGPFESVAGQHSSDAEAASNKAGIAGLRFISHKTKAALVAPAAFDASWVKRSSAQPAVHLRINHVFGLSSSLHSGNIIHVLPASLPKVAGSAGNSSTVRRDTRGAQRMNEEGVKIIYASAALGIIHNTLTNTQQYFNEHTDDISCITLSPDGLLAATGTVGKNPAIKVWATDSQDLKNTLGQGFFIRSISGLAFSFDSRYLVGLGGDDLHTLGIFDLTSGERVISASVLHSLPPMIKSIIWSPCLMAVHNSKDQCGPVDVIVTAGEHHLRMWSFQRPVVIAPSVRTVLPVLPVLSYTALTIPRTPSSPHSAPSAPKVYTCCTFILCEYDKTYDVAAGGNNGLVYLFRKGQCIAHCSAVKGGVKCLAVFADRIFCAGANACMKVLDAKTLDVLMSFNIIQCLSNSTVRRDNSTVSRDSGTVRADSTVRKSRVSSTVSPRPSSAARVRPKTGSSSSSIASPSSSVSITSTRPSSANRSRITPGLGLGVHAGVKALTDNPSNPGVMGAEVVVTGIVLVPGAGRSALQSLYAILTLSTGYAVRIEIGNARNPAAREAWGTEGKSHKNMKDTDTRAPDVKITNSLTSTRPIFFYHTGSLSGLATTCGSSKSTSTILQQAVTCGDDRRLCLWDVQYSTLLGRACLPSTGKCCDIDASNTYIAVGTAVGAVCMYSILPNPYHGSSHSPRASEALITDESVYLGLDVLLHQCAYRKDSSEECGDVKFSPCGSRLAMGSRDNCIYLYACTCNSTGMHTVTLALERKLQGHSSFIAHIDWSFDGKLLQSTCGAHELLCWDVTVSSSTVGTAGAGSTVRKGGGAGKLSYSTHVSEVRWKTMTCVFGFGLMGIWPPYADGTDVNAVDVSKLTDSGLGIVVTGDDTGFVNVMNYPCVVKHAPRKRFNGHSSFVQNVRLLGGHGGTGSHMAVSVGGNDSTVIVWEIIQDDDDGYDHGYHREDRGRRDYTNELFN